jgi:RNA polymerase sigma-70 factor (ECF subfamily)
MSESRIDIAALSDEALVARIRAGDQRVFEAWYLAFFESLWRFACRFAPSSATAKDAVQDVFVSIWSQHDKFMVQTSVRAYLYGAVRQRALRYMRHERVVHQAEVLAEATGATWGMGMGGGPSQPDEFIEVAERRAAIRQAVRALPERQREALSLWFTHELGTAEIAIVLGVSDRAVRKLLEKARSRLTHVLRHSETL